MKEVKHTLEYTAAVDVANNPDRHNQTHVFTSKQFIKAYEQGFKQGQNADNIRERVMQEIEKEYGPISVMEPQRKDHFYTMLGILNVALKEEPQIGK